MGHGILSRPPLKAIELEYTKIVLHRQLKPEQKSKAMRQEKIRILLTNDDGIYAPGLYALYEVFKPDFEVHVVAPVLEMSAVGHAITLSSPLRVQKVDRNGSFYGYAVSGTPADCVKIAVKELIKPGPHIIVSGINAGRNVGMDILYSGTVSAATEGAFLGYPAIAVSLDSRVDPDFSLAARVARTVVEFILSNGLSDGRALNVNIPAISESEVKGIRFTRQGTARFEERFERRSDPRGNIYYWLCGETTVDEYDKESDSALLREGYITITPIHYDLTCLKELGRLSTLGPPQLHPK